jgi:hypothetical protein
MRRTICFSTTTTMHDLVLGLFINRYEFGLALEREINTCDTPSARRVGPVLLAAAKRQSAS